MDDEFQLGDFLMVGDMPALCLSAYNLLRGSDTYQILCAEGLARLQFYKRSFLLEEFLKRSDGAPRAYIDIYDDEYCTFEQIHEGELKILAKFCDAV